MTKVAGSHDGVELNRSVDALRTRIDAASPEAAETLLPEVNRLVGDIEAERSLDQTALDAARATYRARFGAGTRFRSRLGAAFGSADDAAQFRRTVIDPIAAEVAADDKALHAARRLKNIGSSDYWYSGSGPGSSSFWYGGRGPGSSAFWYSGAGPGSSQFWYSGTGPGSSSYWYSGQGPGSSSYWYNGRGPGSSHYWYNGPDPAGPASVRLPPWLITVIKHQHIDSD